MSSKSIFWLSYVLGMANALTMLDGEVEPANILNWCVAAANFYCAYCYREF